jgi:hypothetical protein
MLTYIFVAMVAAAPQAEQVVAVEKGVRLEVENLTGDVRVQVWDRNEVRLDAERSDRNRVEIRQRAQRLVVRGRPRGKVPPPQDYRLTIPAWMGVTVAGTNTDVTMQGVGGDVSVETTRGNVAVRGGTGIIAIRSIQGRISLEDAKGRVDIRGVNQDIRVVRINGDITAQTTNGSITLDAVESGNVELYTVNGAVSYSGTILDRGVYRLGTHNGSVGLAVPEHANALVLVRTYNGGFRSSFPVTIEDPRERRRFTVTLGTGSARIELESFNGPIVLRRPGEPPDAGRGRQPSRPEPRAGPQPGR